MKILGYEANLPGKWPVVLYIQPHMKEKYAEKIKIWLEENIGQYNIKWTWWGIYFACQTSAKIYFVDEEAAMAFKVVWGS